jgi:branched-subunit amino acid transport protein
MVARDAWIAILAAGAVTQLLRYVPVLMVRWRGERMPEVLSRILEYAGLATIGSLIAAAVFRGTDAANAAAPSFDIALKMIALAIAFVVYLKIRKSMLSLLMGYASYLLLVLAFAP